jgi:ribonucleoside-diphosphate reductase alpha chain
MSDRRRLPDRRASTTFEVEAFGLRFTVTASSFAHGGLGELFIRNHKCDSGAGIMASDSAIAASLALQFGCPAEVLRKALSRDARGNPSGPLAAALDALSQRPDADGEATTSGAPLLPSGPTPSAGAIEITTLESVP